MVTQNSEFSYSLIPRNNADKVILNAPDMIDTCIINLVDTNGDIVANLMGDLLLLYEYTKTEFGSIIYRENIFN